MSAPTIDRAVVTHVARLASLSLSDAETERFAAELDRIVAHVRELDALDTRDVPATAHVQIGETPWRADVVRPGLSREDALSQAPQVEEHGFAVPTFVE
jgi:aspartyl-tRNA(Asn)/glutamyl-tRNA(Gln) amidotransferase subunit C